MNIKTYKKLFAIALVSIPIAGYSQGALENPSNGVIESGIGIISGWHCTATRVDLLLDNQPIGSAFVGSARGDTASICNGKSETGFSYLINFNELTRGSHNIKVLANGIKFGETNFSTTKSGGVSFLTGVNKQVTVTDFPSPGSSATLVWNQSKQSFVVTNTQTSDTPPSNPPPATISGIAKLYGNVNFTYRFTGSSTIYRDSAFFSSANLTSDGYLLAQIRNGSGSIACTRIQTSPEFLCVLGYNSGTGGIDVFIFDVSSTGAISGAYEYCLSSTTANACVNDLLNSPDGTVSGTVARLSTSAIEQKGPSINTATAKNKEKLMQLEIEDGEALSIPNTSAQIESVGTALEGLRKILGQ